MGKVYTKLFGKKPVRILILGLDASGKTTALYQMKLGELVETIPTIGFNVETFEHENLTITMWDVGGREKSRPLMRHYYPNTDAIVYIVDSNDRERIDETRDEMKSFLKEDELRKCPLLVLANKQDLSNPMSPEYVAEKLGLHQFRDRTWHIQATCAVTGEGLHAGFSWLSGILSYKKAVETFELASKVITDNKTLTTGWTYAYCGLNKVRNWIWGSKPILQPAYNGS